MARKRATLSDLLNDLTYRTIYNKYKLIALNRFKWNGLPPEIEEKHLEYFLYKYGAAIFFEHPSMRYLCLQATPGAELNVYGEPLKWWATGYNYNEQYSADDCVIISNNKVRLNTRDIIMHYAYKLAEIERTADVNVKACKTPYIFACDDKDVLSFKQIFAKIDGNVPAIYADKGLNLDSIQVLQTGVKFIGTELEDYKRSVECDLLTILGENNSPIDKKERVTTVESRSNNQLIQSFCDLQLESRQLAAEAISKKYNLDVTVEVRNKGEVIEHEPVSA